MEKEYRSISEEEMEREIAEVWTIKLKFRTSDSFSSLGVFGKVWSPKRYGGGLSRATKGWVGASAFRGKKDRNEK